MAALLDAPPPFAAEWLAALSAEVMTKGFAVRDGISSMSGVDPAACRSEAESRRVDMKTATISTGTSNAAESSKRSDRVSFLKPDADLAAASPHLFKHVAWVEALRAGLEAAAPLGTEKATFMLAEYPGGAAIGYVKHRDAAPSPFAGRKLTCLYYLNPAWEASHGGQLHIWPRSNDGTELDPMALAGTEGAMGADHDEVKASPSGGGPEEGPSEEVVAVEPLMDRLVVFRSSLEHEVQPAYSSRMALTAWFVNRRHLALELMCEQLSLNQDRVERPPESAEAVPLKAAKGGAGGAGGAGGCEQIPAAKPPKNESSVAPKVVVRAPRSAAGEC
jgi:hypothetical protein